MEQTTNMTLENIRDAKYIALETFRKNGEGVITPVWQAGEDGKLYVWTVGHSWKVKRLRNNNHSRVCESDYIGKPKSSWVDAQARILETPEEEQQQHKRMADKYGLQFWIFYLLAKLRRDKFVVLEISVAKIQEGIK